jgi:hypothetical protein
MQPNIIKYFPVIILRRNKHNLSDKFFSKHVMYVGANYDIKYRYIPKVGHDVCVMTRIQEEDEVKDNKALLTKEQQEAKKDGRVTIE